MSILELPYELICIIAHNVAKHSLAQLCALEAVNIHLYTLIQPLIAAKKAAYERYIGARGALITQLGDVKHESFHNFNEPYPGHIPLHIALEHNSSIISLPNNISYGYVWYSIRPRVMCLKTCYCVHKICIRRHYIENNNPIIVERVHINDAD